MKFLLRIMLITGLLSICLPTQANEYCDSLFEIAKASKFNDLFIGQNDILNSQKGCGQTCAANFAHLVDEKFQKLEGIDSIKTANSIESFIAQTGADTSRGLTPEQLAKGIEGYLETSKYRFETSVKDVTSSFDEITPSTLINSVTEDEVKGSIIVITSMKDGDVLSNHATLLVSHNPANKTILIHDPNFKYQFFTLSYIPVEVDINGNPKKTLFLFDHNESRTLKSDVKLATSVINISAILKP
ncbi:MAG: hypothetical protein ACOYL6_17940 [Bacteriovoracaceae bacterium]